MAEQSIRENSFSVDSVCDEIISKYAKQAMKSFRQTVKEPI